MIAVSHIPPSPGAFESRVADKFVGRLDAPTAQRIPPFTLGAVVNALAVLTQVADELRNGGSGRIGDRAQALQASDHSLHLPCKQAGHCCFHPLPRPRPVLAVLDLSQSMDVRR